MNEFFEKIKTWVKGNPIIAAVGGLVVVLLLFPKLFRTARRRRIRHSYRPLRIHRTRGVRRHYTRGGKAKKAWQIKGSMAARRHMARIRRLRRA